MKRQLIAFFLFVLALGFFINLLAPFDLEFIEKAPPWLLALLGIPVVIYLVFEFANLLPISRESSRDDDTEDR